MVDISLQGKPIQTIGAAPQVGESCPNFTLIKGDLSEFELAMHIGQAFVLNIFPSLDTAVCAASVREFNRRAAQVHDVNVLCISADLPFAHKRFCDAEGIENVMNLSSFRSPEFGGVFGLTMTTGPLRGLLARSVFVLDDNHRIRYRQIVSEITQEPDYESVFSAL